MNRVFPIGVAMIGAALLSACGGGRATAPSIAPATLTQIGVNSYLWRAALDTVSFAPIAQADSNGGVIVTEWNEFREPNFQRMRQLMRAPVVFDGRNIYSPEHMRALGFTYFSIGR